MSVLIVVLVFLVIEFVQLESCDYLHASSIFLEYNATIMEVSVGNVLEISFDLQLSSGCQDNWCHLLKIGDLSGNYPRLPLINIPATTQGLDVVFSDSEHRNAHYSVNNLSVINTMTDGNWHTFYFKWTQMERLFIYDGVTYYNETNTLYNSSEYINKQYQLMIVDSFSPHISTGNMSNLCINTNWPTYNPSYSPTTVPLDIPTINPSNNQFVNLSTLYPSINQSYASISNTMLTINDIDTSNNDIDGNSQSNELDSGYIVIILFLIILCLILIILIYLKKVKNKNEEKIVTSTSEIQLRQSDNIVDGKHCVTNGMDDNVGEAYEFNTDKDNEYQNEGTQNKKNELLCNSIGVTAGGLQNELIIQEMSNNDINDVTGEDEDMYSDLSYPKTVTSQTPNGNTIGNTENMDHNNTTKGSDL